MFKKGWPWAFSGQPYSVLRVRLYTPMLYPKITRLFVVGLATALSAPFISAQEVVEEEQDVKAPEGFVLPPRLRQIAYRDGNPWTFRVNSRLNQGGATVSFGGLGEVASIRNVPGADMLDEVLRGYDDGVVNADGARDNEKDADGNVFSTPGGRYVGLVDGVSQGDFLSYTPGQTRSWAVLSGDQITANGVELNTYSSASNGAQLGGSEDSSALGFEMAVSRRIFKISEKTEISLSGSFGLNDIKSSAAGRVTADLIKMTDIYTLFGTLPSDAPYQAPTAEDLFNSDGGVLLANGLETTVPLQDITANRIYTTTAGGAQVDGNWGVKGAYYSFRVGPQIRSHISERFAVYASFGVMGAFVGTDFEVNESLDITGINAIAPISASLNVNHSELIIGFYGELAAEFWFTPRTAVFFGVAYESLDNFVQTVGGRTASIELGQNMVLQFGITTRF